MEAPLSEDILLQSMKPARYIGREWNVSVKHNAHAALTVALCFPDLYEIGMSNLGMRILYGALNAQESIACERVFACALDRQEVLRRQGSLLCSLESGRALRDFDIVGFSLGHELSYTTVLSMLAQGGIPLLSSQRGKEFPLVIAGGPCAFNPEPMYAFFDLFIIGEAEEAALEFCQLYAKFKAQLKSGAMSKESFLRACAGIEGAYVPSLYVDEYDAHGRLVKFEPVSSQVPAVVRKRIVKDFNASFFPTEWLVPYIQIVHDRITLEVMRGCPNACRFCQARQQYYPLRIRTPEKIIAQAKGAYLASGYEELSLCGLSVSDYPGLGGLLESLVAYFKQKGVSLSLPSLKARTIVGDAASVIASIKKTGLTFAPEAGSEKLRSLLAKNFNLDEFIAVVTQAYGQGYQHVKLYFMIGLPFENEADLDGIVELAVRVSELKKKVAKGGAQVNLSVNALIPKPHTPLQWCAMDTPEAVQRKQRYLRNKIGYYRKLKASFHGHGMSFIEGVLSRGDRRLSRVIAEVYAQGGQLESWDENFDSTRWMQAFASQGIDPHTYLGALSLDAKLPWDFIDVGISKEHLRKEYLALQEQGARAANAHG